MPPGGNGGGRSGDGRSAGGSGSSSVAGPGSSSPGRSANDGRSSTYSDPTPKDKSAGFRPDWCGFLTDLSETIVDVADHLSRANESLKDFLHDVKAFAHDPTDPSHLTDAYQDLQQAAAQVGQAYRSTKEFYQRNKTVIKEAVASALDVAVQVAVAFSPIDWLFDLASLATGQDIFTGYELSKFEKGAIVLGLLTAGIGDDILQMGSRASRYADELGKGVEFAAKHADELEDATHVVTRHGDELADAAHFTARYGDDIVGDARIARRLDEYVTRSDEPARLADDVGSMCKNNSFTAGTPVETEDGPKPIEEIQEGDKVLAEDPETGEQGYFEVVALTNHPTDEILRITIEISDDDAAAEQEADGANKAEDDDSTETEQDVMEITPDHPVYVEEAGWLLAENLEEGDRLRRADGGLAKVLAIERVQLDEPESVYNFTVRGPHTYFVLDAEVLVHNVTCSKIQYAPAMESGLPRTMQRDLMDSLDEDGVIAVRGRPYRAAGLESKYPPKEMWIKDWMIVRKHGNGVREVLDARKVEAGAYDHIRRVDGGYMIKANGRGPEVFISDTEFLDAASKGKLGGQKVLSDFDIADYTRSGQNVADDEFTQTVAKRFNANYGNEVIVHGHLFNGINKSDVVEDLSKNPDRIQGLLNERVYLFNKNGYVGSMRFKDYARYEVANTASNVPSNSALAEPLRDRLIWMEAKSTFLPNGELHPETILSAERIIDGSDLNNPVVIGELTSDGSNISDWGKYTTSTVHSPSGKFQAHFYYNPDTGKVNYNIDYKVIFNGRNN